MKQEIRRVGGQLRSISAIHQSVLFQARAHEIKTWQVGLAMGCSPSHAQQDWRITKELIQVQQCIDNSRWRDDELGLRRLTDAVRTLRNLNEGIFCEDIANRKKLKGMVDVIASGLPELISSDLLRREKTDRIQEIMTFACDFDAFCDAAVSKKVSKRYAEVCNSYVKEMLDNVRTWKGQSRPRVNIIEKTAVFLRQSRPYISACEYSTIQSLLEECGELAIELVTDLPEIMRTDDSFSFPQYPRLLKAADVIDKACESILEHFGSGEWDTMVPQMKEIAEKHSETVCPAALAALEVMFRQKGVEVDYNAVLKHMKAIARACRWTERSVDMKKHIEKIDMVVNRLTSKAFDEALKQADLSVIDGITKFAKEYDMNMCVILDCEPDKNKVLFDKFQQKRVRLALVSRLNTTKENINKLSYELRDMSVEATEAVNAIPKDLWEVADGVMWKYQLAKGCFRDFKEDQSAEIERQYEAWIAKGRPMGEKARQCEIRIEERHTDPRCRPQCEYGDQYSLMDSKHRDHPNDWYLDDNSNILPSTILFVDFHFMTLVNFSPSRGVARWKRAVCRSKGNTRVESATKAYFNKVHSHVADTIDMLEEALFEVDDFPAEDREPILDQVNECRRQMQSVMISDFLGLAGIVGDKQALEGIADILGSYAEDIGIHDKLNELKENKQVEVLHKLKQVFSIVVQTFGIEPPKCTLGLDLQALRKDNILFNQGASLLSDYA